MRIKRAIAALMVGALFVGGASPAAAEDVDFVAGKMWKSSRRNVKRAYLVGISNLMSAEYAYQKETGPPPDQQTTIRRLYEEIDDVTLDVAISRVDGWYEANPDKLDMTVLEVIWLDMVRPNLPESRRYAEDD